MRATPAAFLSYPILLQPKLKREIPRISLPQLGVQMSVTTPAAKASQMPMEAQLTLLVALCTLLLNQKGVETPDKLLLRELCIERHLRENHEGEFISCANESCQQAVNTIAASLLEEATFQITDIDKLKNVHLRYGNPSVGTIRAWLEDTPILIL